MLEAMLMALVAVFTVAEVITKDTFPNECVVVVEEVIDNRGRRVAAELVFSMVDREQRLRIDVPPITIPMAFPSTVRSIRSISTCPTLLTITGSTDAAEF
jgi:hypothetical protein